MGHKSVVIREHEKNAKNRSQHACKYSRLDEVDLVVVRSVPQLQAAAGILAKRKPHETSPTHFHVSSLFTSQKADVRPCD
jgi:hypothetical protein